MAWIILLRVRCGRLSALRWIKPLIRNVEIKGACGRLRPFTIPAWHSQHLKVAHVLRHITSHIKRVHHRLPHAHTLFRRRRICVRSGEHWQDQNGLPHASARAAALDHARQILGVFDLDAFVIRARGRGWRHGGGRDRHRGWRWRHRLVFELHPPHHAKRIFQQRRVDLAQVRVRQRLHVLIERSPRSQRLVLQQQRARHRRENRHHPRQRQRGEKRFVRRVGHKSRRSSRVNHSRQPPRLHDAGGALARGNIGGLEACLTDDRVLASITSMNAVAHDRAPRSKRSFKVVALSIVLVLAACAGLYCGRHTIAPDLINRVKTGMPRDEVIRLLGEPDSSSREKNGSMRLSYRKHDRWCMLDVLLGPEGHVLTVFHDH